MQHFCATTNANLEKITYGNLKIKLSHNIEDTLYQPATDDEYQWTPFFSWKCIFQVFLIQTLALSSGYWLGTVRNTTTKSEVSSKLLIKTPDHHQDVIQVFLLLTWSDFTPSNISTVYLEQVNVHWVWGL